MTSATEEPLTRRREDCEARLNDHLADMQGRSVAELARTYLPWCSVKGRDEVVSLEDPPERLVVVMMYANHVPAGSKKQTRLREQAFYRAFRLLADESSTPPPMPAAFKPDDAPPYLLVLNDLIGIRDRGVLD